MASKHRISMNNMDSSIPPGQYWCRVTPTHYGGPFSPYPSYAVNLVAEYVSGYLVVADPCRSQKVMT